MFRRRNDREGGEPVHDVDPDSFVDDLDPEDRAYEDAELLAELVRQEAEQARALRPPRPQGPWDLADLPPDERARLDLGGLQVPVPEHLEVRVDVSPEGEVIAATLVDGESSLQMNAFAAPKTEGIWAAVRTEIAEALRHGGGSAEEGSGPFGEELHAMVPNEVPGRGVVVMPARFVGIDGPRWFLRGLVTGPAATDPSAAAGLERAWRDVVVVRGGDPMAVRDPLPLVLPKDVAEQVQGDEDPAPPSLQMPERGPEITEIR